MKIAPTIPAKMPSEAHTEKPSTPPAMAIPTITRIPTVQNTFTNTNAINAQIPRQVNK